MVIINIKYIYKFNMNTKFLLCILTSSNEHLLKVSYNSTINQLNHNLDVHKYINTNLNTFLKKKNSNKYI